MTLHRQLFTSKNNIIDIISNDAIVEAHFSNPANYADAVLTQINQERLYDPIFEGEDNLTILDIGGNIGLFALYAQDRAKEIYSVEPTPSHFRVLKEFTKNYSNIHPLPYAVHNSDTIIDFYVNEENSTMNSSTIKYGNKVEVQAKKISSIIKELGLSHVDFIKCDIEGSEMTAITNETISEVRDIVDCWFVEVHAPSAPFEIWKKNLEDNRKSLADIFSKQGYTVQYYRHDGLFIGKE
jgi:FkbM family methyltransferase